MWVTNTQSLKSNIPSSAKLKNEVSSDKDVENINYAINIDYLKPLLKQINLKLEYGNNTKVDICEKVCGSVVRIETN